MADANQPNVADSLIVIHEVVTRGLDVAAERAAEFAKSGFPDEATADGFTHYVRALAYVLDAHHLTEDELAFQDFRDKLPALPVARLMEQHQDMMPLLVEIRALLGQIEAGQSLDANLAALADTLERLDAIWQPHIALEEEHFDRRRIADLMPTEEQSRLIGKYTEHSQRLSGPPEFAVPFILYNLPPEARAQLAASMPKEITDHLVPVVWKAKWGTMQPFLLE